MPFTLATPRDVAFFFVLRHLAGEVARLRSGNGDIAAEIAALHSEISRTILDANIQGATRVENIRQQAEEVLETLFGSLALEIRQRGG